MAINLIIAVLGSVPTTLLIKNLEFRSLLKIGVFATTISGCVAIAMASVGMGEWSLACQFLIASVVNSTLVWFYTPWRPRLAFSWGDTSRLRAFGVFILLSSLLEVFFSRLNTILIGKIYGAAELGFYTRAETSKQFPVNMLSSIISRVAMPVFSQHAADKTKLRQAVQMSSKTLMAVNTPLMLTMVALADPLVRLVFGPAWVAMIPILQVLCLGGVLWPLHVLNLNALMAQGHSNLFFRLELLKKGAGIILLMAGCLWGVLGIAWSQVGFSLVALVINAHYSGKMLQYGLLAQLRDCLPPVLISTPIMVVIFAIPSLLPSGPVYQLSLSLVLGGLYFYVVSLAFKVNVVRYAKSLFGADFSQTLVGREDRS
jgi:O-antigen/teichoic acid export membrane protein